MRMRAAEMPYRLGEYLDEIGKGNSPATIRTVLE
jgi:hypothetical protein